MIRNKTKKHDAHVAYIQAHTNKGTFHAYKQTKVHANKHRTFFAHTNTQRTFFVRTFNRGPPGPGSGAGSGTGALPGQGNHLLSRRTRGAGGGPLEEEGEFDFEAGLAKFDKEKVGRSCRGVEGGGRGV